MQSTTPGRLWVFDELHAFIVRPLNIAVLVIFAVFLFRQNMMLDTLNLGDAFRLGAFGPIAEHSMQDQIFWIVDMMPVFIMAGLYIEQELKRGAYSVLRMRSYGTWWYRKMAGLSAGVLLYYAAYFLLLVAGRRISGGSLTLAAEGELSRTSLAAYLWCPILIYVNGLLFSAATMALQATTGSQKLAFSAPMGVYLVTIMIGFSIPQLMRFSIGSWGMVSRSSLMDSYDLGYFFDPLTVVIVQLVLLLAILFLVPPIMRRREAMNRKQL